MNHDRKAHVGIVVSFVIIGLLIWADGACAQDKTVRIVGWDSFVSNLTYVVRSDSFAEWHHNGEKLDNHTVVEVPADRLTVRNMYEITSSGDAVMYLAVLDPDISVSSRQVSLRAMFYCNASATECPALLSRILRGRLSMQATAVTTRDDTTHGRVTLEFYINSTGRFVF